MNKLKLFLFSKDGLVTLTAFTLFSIVNIYSEPYNPWINFLARIGTLSIVSYILWRAIGKKASNFLSQRQQGIIKKFDDLKEQEQNTQLQILEIEKRMINIDREKQEILFKYENQANKLREKVINETEDKVNYIYRQAEHAVETISNNVLQNLYKTLAVEIITTTEVELKKSLDMTKQYKLIDNALKKVTFFE